MEKIQTVINTIWQQIDHWINNDGKLLSSEKSIVFNFAWEFTKHFNEALIDFETSIFGEFSDGQFLDLLIIIKNEQKELKVGFEFKFPKKVKHNSDRTETRQKIINDLKRLSWLVENNKIDLGCFLCLTNESSYANPKEYKKANHFLTHHGKRYQGNLYFPENEKYAEKVKVINDIEFKWRYIRTGSKYIIEEEKSYSLLEPIFISKSTNA